MIAEFVWPSWFLGPAANLALETFVNDSTLKVSTSRLQASYGPLMRMGTESDISNKLLCTSARPRSYTGESITPSTEFVFPYIFANLQPSIASDLHSMAAFLALYSVHYKAGSALPPSLRPSQIRRRIDNADMSFINTFFHKKMTALKKEGVEVIYDTKHNTWSLSERRLHEYAAFPEIRFVLEATNRAAETETTVHRLRQDVSRATLGINTAIASCGEMVQNDIRRNLEALLKAQAEITFIEALSLYDVAKVEAAQAEFEEQGAVSHLLGGHVIKNEKTALDKYIDAELNYSMYAGGFSSGGGEGGRRLRLAQEPAVSTSRDGTSITSNEEDTINDVAAAMLVGNVALHAVLESKLGPDVNAKTITLLSSTLYRAIHASGKTGILERLKNAAIAIRNTDGLGTVMLEKMNVAGFNFAVL